MRNDLSDLATFAIIAEERSFTRAARRLRVSQSALSHSMRGLEKRLGVQLLARTTRSVSPTAAGDALLKDLAPALEQIERSLNETRKRRERPAGRIRLVVLGRRPDRDPERHGPVGVGPEPLDGIAPGTGPGVDADADPAGGGAEG